MTPVTRDPKDPDFPHGTPAGNRRGCTSETGCPAEFTCTDARRRQRKAAELSRHRGGPGRSIPATETYDHIQALIAAVPTASPSSIARAAGVDPMVPRRLTRNSRTHPDTARKILAVTADQLQTEIAFIDVNEARLLVRQLQACGFPMEWTHREAGVKLNKLLYEKMARAQDVVHRSTYEAIKAVFDRVDGRMADPRVDGIHPRQISLAKTIATKAGVYPPACYNEDGTLNLRALPDHSWAQADDRCAALIELAHLLATTGNRAEAIRAAGDRPGDEQRATRIVRRLGITFAREETDETTGETHRFVYEPHEARQVNRDIFDHIETTWDAYDSGTIGPVYAALTIGVAKLGNRGAGSLPQDHPEVLEWRAEQDAEDELDQVQQAA